MSNPKVSIILTTHGPAPYLKQAIGSVLAQTFEDWECIVVHDSNDWWKGQAEVRALDSRFDAYFDSAPSNVPCRFAYTINSAFKYSSGDYITYLCHDDLYLPWRLKSMLFDLEDRKWDVVFGHQQLIHESDQFFKLNIRMGQESQPAGTVDHSSVMHRRECFEKAGGWDENAPPRFGDAYFWLRLQNAGYKFHCIPEVLDVHRFNRESITWKEDHPESNVSKGVHPQNCNCGSFGHQGQEMTEQERTVFVATSVQKK